MWAAGMRKFSKSRARAVSLLHTPQKWRRCSAPSRGTRGRSRPCALSASRRASRWRSFWSWCSSSRAFVSFTKSASESGARRCESPLAKKRADARRRRPTHTLIDHTGMRARSLHFQAKRTDARERARAARSARRAKMAKCPRRSPPSPLRATRTTAQAAASQLHRAGPRVLISSSSGEGRGDPVSRAQGPHATHAALEDDPRAPNRAARISFFLASAAPSSRRGSAARRSWGCGRRRHTL